MKTYEVGVARIYLVKIKCESAEEAVRIAPNCLAIPEDGSLWWEREEANFEFVGQTEVVQSEGWLEGEVQES